MVQVWVCLHMILWWLLWDCFCVCIAGIVVRVVWVDCCVGGGARAVCVGLLLMVLMLAVLRF